MRPLAAVDRPGDGAGTVSFLRCSRWDAGARQGDDLQHGTQGDPAVWLAYYRSCPVQCRLCKVVGDELADAPSTGVSVASDSYPDVTTPALNECSWCGQALGTEQVRGIVVSDDEIGLIGWVHSTNCADSYWRQWFDSGVPFRLVELA